MTGLHTPTDAPPRLTFRWWPSFSAEYTAEVAITERLSSIRSKSTTYAVAETTPLPGDVRVFMVRKQGMKPGEWYEVHVGPKGHACSCPGATYRRQNICCRHLQAVQYLAEEGVF